jgi:3-dehydroquinate synthase
MNTLNNFSPNKIAIIADQNVLQLFPYYLDELYADVSKFVFSVLPGEQNKSIDEVVYLWQNLQEHHFDKNSLIINFGGGMVMDLGGFVASTYQRGIPFTNIPTTLLSMIDAAIGGKNGINLNSVKNAVGTINLPQEVIINPQFLMTLPPQQLLNGFGEMLKYALIGNKTLWDELKVLQSIYYQDIKKQWIDECVAFKEKIVHEDLYDNGLRHILNFGHTIGHGIEAWALDNDYRDATHCVSTENIPHGHAVALGMVAESYLSMKYGLLASSEYDEIRNTIIRFYGGYLQNIDNQNIPKIVSFCLHDKKNLDGRINITMLEGIGHASPNHWVSEEECEEAIRELSV